jgi:hypothetical protein
MRNLPGVAGEVFIGEIPVGKGWSGTFAANATIEFAFPGSGARFKEVDV